MSSDENKLEIRKSVSFSYPPTMNWLTVSITAVTQTHECVS